jgi:hypothetical protein
MERITTLLEKIKELNHKPDPALIDVDLMMDYARVLYADLFEWRKKLAFNEAVTIKTEAEERAIAGGLEANQSAVAQPEIAGPAVELDNTVLNFEQSKNERKPLSYPDPHYSNADIRQRIGVNDKYQFISELFGNNKDAYEEVISEINTFDTEEEAITWINNSVGSQFRWQDDTESVQNFYRLLGEFFASR